MQEIEEGPDGAFQSLTIDRNSTSFKGTCLVYVFIRLFAVVLVSFELFFKLLA